MRAPLVACLMLAALFAGAVLHAVATPPPQGRELPNDWHGILRFHTSWADPPRCTFVITRTEVEYLCVKGLQ